MLSLGIMEEVAENLNLEHPQIHDAASNAKTFRHQSRVFNNMSLYTQRLNNQAQRLMTQLKNLQDDRHEQERQQMIEAARVYKFKKMQGEEFEPIPDGFVYSIAEIETYLRRQTVKQHAEIAEMCQLKRDSVPGKGRVKAKFTSKTGPPPLTELRDREGAAQTRRTKRKGEP